MRCPLCQAAVPEVIGAATQVCPQCGAETPAAAAPEATPARPDRAAALRLAFGAVRRHYLTWLALYLPLAVLALAVEVSGILAARAAGYGPTPVEDPRRAAVLVLLWLPFALVEQAFAVAFLGVGAALTARAATGARIRAADGVALLRARGASVLGAAAVFVLVVVAAVAIAALPAGIVSIASVDLAVVVALSLSWIPFVFVHRYLWTTAFVAEGDGPGRAFQRSRGLARRPGMRAMTLTVVLGALAVGLARYGAGSLLAPLLGDGDIALAVATALVGIPFLPVVPALVGSCLVAARATAPKAGASVACPSCGEPISYVATGAPQRLVCGRCGRTGTVT